MTTKPTHKGDVGQRLGEGVMLAIVGGIITIATIWMLSHIWSYVRGLMI